MLELRSILGPVKFGIEFETPAASMDKSNGHPAVGIAAPAISSATGYVFTTPALDYNQFYCGHCNGASAETAGKQKPEL